ncbi:MAG: GNAT family N-acetyltransferase [Pseudomonadota bacterium]
MQTVTTSRLTLRALHSDDATAMAMLADDWLVASMLATMPHPFGVGDARDFLMRRMPEALARGDFVWAITLRGAETALIGCIGCHHKEEQIYPDLGYWLGRPFWGRGLASEAARAVCAHCFAAWPVEALESGHFLENVASARVLEKAGFEAIGAKTFPCLARGQPVEGRAMRLTRARWRSLGLAQGVGP